jgi:hypothetical protein
MRFFMSGTPRNDPLQLVEDTLCTCRLFSLHGSYQRAVMKWLEAVKQNPDRKYPRIILLDSGAFTGWNKGEDTRLEEVYDAYSAFEERAEGLFDEIYMINLDKIPGQKGRDPTLEELKDAIRISDENYLRLVDKFGSRILPVYHQGEANERLFEVAEMGDYICVSPRNDLPEGKRKIWSETQHHELTKRYGFQTKRTHGLATTGNSMINDVPWHSIDSAAWILHAGFGKVDIFCPDPHNKESRYRNWFVSYEGGKARLRGQHVDTVGEEVRRLIVDTIGGYGFTLEQAQADSRIRSLICMGELNRYTDWSWDRQQERRGTIKLPTGEQLVAQPTLFGEI